MIFGRHSVLKRGCSTWDRQQMPKAEFDSRLERIRAEMSKQGLDALLIYGDNYAFADICYLTNYFPKVRGGIAIVPRRGPLSLLLNIGSRDVPFAKTLTWVEDVRASNQVGREGAALLKEKGLGDATVGLVDSGQGFPLPELEQMKGALPEIHWVDSHAIFSPIRLKKSPAELSALRAAGRVLADICDCAAALMERGKKEYQVIADIDRLARDKGVEDIRIMAGDDGLRPPNYRNLARLVSHWTLYLAIQYERYWVESGRTYILAPDSKLYGVYQKAQEIVGQIAGQLKPGNPVAAIDQCARNHLGEFYATASLYGLGNGIGLNQWEAPFLSEEEARQAGATLPNVASVDENMAVALRVAFESDGKLVMHGDSFEVTATGAVSLVRDWSAGVVE